MRHLDLFSGIGGFALATEMVWEDVEHVFCDNDPFSQAVLKKHWPNSLIYGDIKALKGSEITGGGIDLLTGGFPCQPFSAAGKRKGTDDDRHLWPEMLRVIRETRPEWIIGENVSGLLTWDAGVVFEQVCADLEGEGYEVWPFSIPAAAVGAPHRRERIWIVAHADRSADRRTAGRDARSRASQRIQQRDSVGQPSLSDSLRVPSYAESIGSGRSASIERGVSQRELLETEQEGSALRREGEGRAEHATDASSVSGTRSRTQGEGHCGERGGTGREERASWEQDWPAVAALLCAVDDGLPDGLAGPDGRGNAKERSLPRIGRPRPRTWRNAALKGAGNAIVPHVAAEVMRAIALASA